LALIVNEFMPGSLNARQNARPAEHDAHDLTLTLA